MLTKTHKKFEKLSLKEGIMKARYEQPKLVILMQSADVLCSSPQNDYVGNIWNYDAIRWE